MWWVISAEFPPRFIPLQQVLGAKNITYTICKLSSWNTKLRMLKFQRYLPRDMWNVLNFESRCQSRSAKEVIQIQKCFHLLLCLHKNIWVSAWVQRLINLPGGGCFPSNNPEFQKARPVHKCCTSDSFWQAYLHHQGPRVFEFWKMQRTSDLVFQGLWWYSSCCIGFCRICRWNKDLEKGN